MTFEDFRNKLVFRNGPEDPIYKPIPPEVPLPQYITNTVFGLWDQAKENLVVETLESLYNSPSDKAKDLMHDLIFSHLFVYRSTNGSRADHDVTGLAIDFSDVGDLKYIGGDGTIKDMSFERLLIHELYHAIKDYKDLKDPVTGDPYSATDQRFYNHANFDHLGQTVNETNEVMIEAGLETEEDARVGYDATWKVSDTLKLVSFPYA